MYLSTVIDEKQSGAGRRRVIIEKPISENVFIVKGIFRCPSEAAARRYADFLIDLREPKATKPEAPAPAPGLTSKPKRTQTKEAATNGKDKHRRKRSANP